MTNQTKINIAWDKSDGETITRTQVETDDGKHRMYSGDDTSWPSVSTVLDSRPTPDKDASIEGWRNWLLSQPDKPNPDDVMQYKGSRGTLTHYYCLNPLARRDMMSDEEIESYQQLKGWEYEHGDALSKAREDVDWAVREFQDLCELWDIAHFNGRGTDIREVTSSRVRAVEHYCVNREHEYAGQFDLAYQNHDNNTVLADIKTSNADSVSGLIDKKWPRYGLQLAGYADAVNYDISDLQVIWVAPDSRESAIIPVSKWPEPWEYYRSWFGQIADDTQERLFSDS